MNGTIVDIIQGIVIAIITAYNGVNAYREKQLRKQGIRSNPARCKEHDDRLRALELAVARIETKLDSISHDINDLENK